MSTYEISGRVCLEVEATVETDEVMDETYAANILKGGYFDTHTVGIDVEDVEIEELREVAP